MENYKYGKRTQLGGKLAPRCVLSFAWGRLAEVPVTTSCAVTMHRSLVAVLALALVLNVALSACPKDAGAVTRWSTWSGKPTSAGAVVTIPAGQRVLLDESPGKGFLINKIDVHGAFCGEPHPLEPTTSALGPLILA